MRRDNPPIIAERPGPAGVTASGPRATRRLSAAPVVVLLAAVIVGGAAAAVYASRDLTLSHYDARAHLMVARRITDSLTPGWRQIGAVWLPLPHLLQLPLVQWDWAYRTGYPSAALSVLALGLGLSAFAGYVRQRTGSLAGALVAPALILLNPNILYLQSTPMTEPLLLGLSLGAVVAVDRWVRRRDPSARRVAGAAIAALMLTRYEGWCVGGALVGLAALLLRRHGPRVAFGLVPHAAAAVLGFLLLSWGTTGRWFVASGFFVPDNPAQGNGWVALMQVFDGARQLGGATILAAGAAGLVRCLAPRRTSASRPVEAGALVGTAILPVALVAAMALPWFAFYQGHPFRVRYMVPLVAASGALAGVALSGLHARPRLAAGLAVVLVALAVFERPPFDASAPMVLEAQWETPLRAEREAVTRYLVDHHDGEPILASMGSLGHYMQETSAAGLPLATFLHEGNGDLFHEAVRAPAYYVRWVLLEERAEGGDMLAALARADSEYLARFARVAQGGGMALYRRR